LNINAIIFSGTAYIYILTATVKRQTVDNKYNMATFGESIRIYLSDETVTGIKFGEIVNKTIQSISCPRLRTSELNNYPESKKPGVYFLFGQDEETGDTKTYIGEAENVYSRLQDHIVKKEFGMS